MKPNNTTNIEIALAIIALITAARFGLDCSSLIQPRQLEPQRVECVCPR